MIRELGCSKALRRLYHALDVANSAAATTIVATGIEAENPQPIKETKQLPRLWAMQRLSTSRRHLETSMKAWRIPGSFDIPLAWLPPDLGRLLYMDRLQVNKFYWVLGYPGFVCERFHLDVYDPSWVRNHNTAKVVGSVEVYPQMLNINGGKDVINITLVRAMDYGLRCPIHFSGEQECIGVKNGGIFKKSLYFLAFECDINLPPPKILLDVANLDVGEQILIKDLNLNLELRRNLDPSTAICEVLIGSGT